MNALRRSGAAGFAIGLLLATSPAGAVHRGEGDLPEVSATEWTKLDLSAGLGYRPDLWGALQGPDCNRAGTANPQPVPTGEFAPRVGVDWSLRRGLTLRANYFESADANGGSGYPSVEGDAGDGSGLGFRLDSGFSDPSLWQYMAFPRGVDFSFPGEGSANADRGYDASPFKGTFGSDGGLRLGGGYTGEWGGREIPVRGRGYGSFNVEGAADQLPGSLGGFRPRELRIGGNPFTSLKFKDQKYGPVYNGLSASGLYFEPNWCRVVLVPPADPHYARTGRHGGGSWGQPQDDQWAIKRVGYTDDDLSAWNLVPDTVAPVVVAVIDTGLDWHHLDIDPENVWRNPGEVPDNGIDDDGNGFVDDIIGWDFLGGHNKPWDFDGHGTVVAGIIAARQGNGAGIAGINRHAKLMVLKAVNNFGTSRASFLAEAIVYAADNGARVINISVGGPHTSRMEQAAIAYAHGKGVLVVAAAGNEGVELEDYGPGGGDHVLTVGATHTDDRAAGFSNYGERVDLVAPGVDVLSLRARYTDANYRGTDDYAIGDHYVGEDKRYLHVSGTSFAAPIVTATAALLMAKRPELSGAEVERILLATAEDLEYPGVDAYTGAGMLDARTALGAGADFYVTAEIDGVGLVQTEAGQMLQVRGTADAQVFKRAWLEIGPGEKPGSWKAVGRKIKFPVRGGELSKLYLGEFRGNELWQVVVNVEHKNGALKRAVYPVRIK